MFAFGLLTNKPAPASAAVPEQAEANAAVTLENMLKLTQPGVMPPGAGVDIEDKLRMAMTEKQLRDLTYEVRDKINQYDTKLQELAAKEQNLQVAQETLKKDIAELENLRVELASTISAIKTEQEKLQKSKIEIAGIEKTNLVSIAATYDKMDAAQAGKILSNMCRAKGGNADDAVKILYYMSDRTKAKVLASIAETEPAVSADFCQKLKKISEKKE